MGLSDRLFGSFSNFSASAVISLLESDFTMTLRDGGSMVLRSGILITTGGPCGLTGCGTRPYVDWLFVSLVSI